MASRKLQKLGNRDVTTPQPVIEDYDEMRPRFVEEEAIAIVKEAIRVTLDNRQYHEKKLKEWMSEVTERTLSELARLAKPMKYAVTCFLMLKSGAGLQVGSACRWHGDTDGTCLVKWENETMLCLVTVDGVHA